MIKNLIRVSLLVSISSFQLSLTSFAMENDFDTIIQKTTALKNEYNILFEDQKKLLGTDVKNKYKITLKSKVFALLGNTEEKDETINSKITFGLSSIHEGNKNLMVEKGKSFTIPCKLNKKTMNISIEENKEITHTYKISSNSNLINNVNIEGFLLSIENGTKSGTTQYLDLNDVSRFLELSADLRKN